MRAGYRFRQGLRALVAWLRPVDDALAHRYLSPALYELYRRMRRSERQHSLRVLQDLLAAGHTHPDLLTAALLHDVGKSRVRFTLPEKVLVVLVRAAAPQRYRAWSQGPARGWRLPFAVSEQHPAWGADMAAAAGASPLTVTLIRRHAEALTGPPRDEAERLLLALQQVDDRN
ncbi:MAG: hypothetical protein Kow00106_08990 [Anaerolineae bacterium]